MQQVLYNFLSNAIKFSPPNETIELHAARERDDYIRISVTDRCNIRCFYCMPEDGVKFMPREEILSFEEIARFVRVAASLGVTKVRLTGGEPLVRKELPVRFPHIADIRTAVVWYKACSVFKPDYYVEYLTDSPWIHQPFEIYDNLRPEGVKARLEK